MDKIELIVNEFMTIMGTLDEKFGGRQVAAGDSIYAAWHEQWRALDARLEKLGLMERADMLFDGKVAINALAEQHFRELIQVVEGRVAFNQQLLEANITKNHEVYITGRLFLALGNRTKHKGKGYPCRLQAPPKDFDKT